MSPFRTDSGIYGHEVPAEIERAVNCLTMGVKATSCFISFRRRQRPPHLLPRLYLKLLMTLFGPMSPFAMLLPALSRSIHRMTFKSRITRSSI